MGTWDYGIFDNDVALMVRLAFEEELRAGLDVPAATQQVMEQFPLGIRDYDDRPVIYLALAALQIEYNALQPDVRKEALNIIETGEGEDGWDETGTLGSELDERKRILADLRTQLLQF